MTSTDLAAARMIATAYIRREQDTDEWLCACGNTSGGTGYHTCLPDGTLTEPTIGGQWAGHYICADCDAIMASDGLIVRTGSTSWRPSAGPSNTGGHA